LGILMYYRNPDTVIINKETIQLIRATRKSQFSQKEGSQIKD